MQIVGISADGKLLCDNPASTEKAEVALDDVGFEKLIKMLSV
jgi:hypothetical protein